jgi:hypothetical protein
MIDGLMPAGRGRTLIYPNSRARTGVKYGRARTIAFRDADRPGFLAIQSRTAIPRNGLPNSRRRGNECTWSIGGVGANTKGLRGKELAWTHGRHEERGQAEQILSPMETSLFSRLKWHSKIWVGRNADPLYDSRRSPSACPQASVSSILSILERTFGGVSLPALFRGEKNEKNTC